MRLQISFGRRGPALALTVYRNVCGGRRLLHLALWLRRGGRRSHAVLWRFWMVSAHGSAGG